MLSQISNTPWKFFNKIGSFLIYPWVRILFSANHIQWGKGWQFFGAPVIQKHRHSMMSFGSGLMLRSSTRSNPLGINHPVFLATLCENACLEIEKNFAMSGGSICVAERVRIGNRVALGANSIIADTDFHPIDLLLRQQSPQQGKTSPIFIQDDVFVGMNCIILKGVTIGQGSIIGAGSVITKDVPPGVIVAGNPANIIREIRS